jgi:hypothetical protein
MEGTEKTGVRDFEFCEQRESLVLQGRKRLREEERGSQDQRMALWLILNEIWKSKMEIPVESRHSGWQNALDLSLSTKEFSCIPSQTPC